MAPSEREKDLAAWLNLSLVPGLGPVLYRSLLSAFGLPSNILAADRNQLVRVVPSTVAAAISAGGREKAVDATLAWAAKTGNTILTLADKAYPAQLFEIPDPPALLYVTGDPALLSATSLALVGSRNATPQGLANAEQFARVLSEAGMTIVSGLALGIDAAAHRGALAGRGSTVAVMGCGPDQIYPRRNTALAAEISRAGVLITEFPLGTQPLAGNFPRRNRLIAGLSRGVLVIEAALASGSLITARLAADQGRDIFAIPGSIHSPLSKGCHSLIKQGAKLVENAQDVLDELGWTSIPAAPQKPNSLNTTNELLQYMGFDPCDISTLAMRAGLTTEAVSAMLLQLELEGFVGSVPGGFYQRLI